MKKEVNGIVIDLKIKATVDPIVVTVCSNR